jgi:hypothetical protein
MKYLLDSDTLIRAKNDHYPFDSFPGFWSWLEQLNGDGVAFSIDKVKKELIDEGDQLSHWVRMRGSSFFLRTDGAETQKTLSQLVGWVSGMSNYTLAAQNEFFSSADLMLVSHAMAGGFTIVSFEEEADKCTTRIKIPTIGKRMGVRTIKLYQLIKESPRKLML